MTDRETMVKELKEKFREFQVQGNYALARYESIMTDEDETVPHKLFAAILHIISRGVYFVGNCLWNYVNKKYHLEG